MTLTAVHPDGADARDAAFTSPVGERQAAATIPNNEIPAAVVAAFTVLSVLIGSISLGNGLYLSQFFLIGLLAVALFNRGREAIIAPIAKSAAVIGVMAAFSLLAQATETDRFLPEFFKTALLLVGAIILWGQVGWRGITATAKVAPLCALGVVVFVYVTGQGDYYGDEGRFGVPWWGSPNSTGFLLNISVALWLLTMHESLLRPAQAADRALVFGLQLAVLLGLIGFLIFTGSSGGRLALIVIAASYASVRMRTLLGLAALGAFAFWALDLELPELIGSGRLMIWQMLIDEQFAAPKTRWLFGFGTGSIDLTPWFTAHVQSAHNMFVEALYSWGVLAPLGLLLAIRNFARRVAAASLPPPQRLFVSAIFGALVAGFFVDTYIMAAQLTWLGALILGCGGLVRSSPR